MALLDRLTGVLTRQVTIGAYLTGNDAGTVYGGTVVAKPLVEGFATHTASGDAVRLNSISQTLNGAGLGAITVIRSDTPGLAFSADQGFGGFLWEFTIDLVDPLGVASPARIVKTLRVDAGTGPLDLELAQPSKPVVTSGAVQTITAVQVLQIAQNVAAAGVPDGSVTRLKLDTATRAALDNAATGNLADAGVTTVKIAPAAVTLAKTAPDVRSILDGAVQRNALTNKIDIADIPDGIGGEVGPGDITTVKIAPLAVTLPKLDDALASRVEVPRFVPQEQTTVLGLPVAYVRNDSPTITKANTGLPTIYWPYLMRVPEATFAAYPGYGRWRLYLSTDHNSGAGGIACMKTDALRPGDAGVVWTSIRLANNNPTIFKVGSSDQVETPTVIFNPETGLFNMFYQIQGGRAPGGGLYQRTDMATSVDGINNWTIVPGAGMPNPPSDWLGYRHTGYARVWLIDGQWVSWHLSGGGDQSTYGWSYSNDGITWVMDRRRILTAGRWGGSLGRLGISSLVKFRGQLWAIGRVSGYSSGIKTSGVSAPFMAPMRDDLLAPLGKLQDLPAVVDPAIGEYPAFGPSFATAADGSLWSAYRTGDQNSSLRFMEVK